MRLELIVVLCLFATLTAPVWAQDYQDGVHVGFVTGGDVRQESVAFGYQASKAINDYLSFEFAITRQDDELEHYIDQVSIPTGFIYDLETYALALSARLGFDLLDRLHVFASAGVGYFIMDADDEQARETIAANEPTPAPATRVISMKIDVDNDFGFHIGGGFTFELTEKWAIFADYRHVSLEPDADLLVVEQRPSEFPRVPFDRIETIHADQLEYEHDLVRVGINYWF